MWIRREEVEKNDQDSHLKHRDWAKREVEREGGRLGKCIFRSSIWYLCNLKEGGSKNKIQLENL